MADNHRNLSFNARSAGFKPSSAANVNPAATPAAQVDKDPNMAIAEQLLLDLLDPKRREKVLSQLCILSKSALFEDLAPVLWNSFGTIAVLLQEIVTIYPLLSPPTLSQAAADRVCNVILLLQRLARHPDTRTQFLNARMPLYLYPFLNTASETSHPFDHLRTASLGVIATLAKLDDPEVMIFLLSSEIAPHILRMMEMESRLSKTLATFILHKVLLDELGLQYMCATAQRFFALGKAMKNVVASLNQQTFILSLSDHYSRRQLQYIVGSYLRLADNPRARKVLEGWIPGVLKDASVSSLLYAQDKHTWQRLNQLLQIVGRTN